ncbi:uncharacterized protein KGF55_000622 [Candida pseudojiufengensis]|uniref:uncharacterized protein n=1 Tax=Candida pseudojiufengensis TaxID=497109 RepID=UPI00222451E6|nr:uncharacterized protein KGF55_000622 [Candida pseudojiufengensis]KAI5966313.1 hypothetical protein KGF55_000622 [Candida pseudojiufengensis]
MFLYPFVRQPTIRISLHITSKWSLFKISSTTLSIRSLRYNSSSSLPSQSKSIAKKNQILNQNQILKQEQILDKPIENEPHNLNENKLTETPNQNDKQIPISQISKLSKPLFDPSIWTVPNILTYTRIITTPIIGYFIIKQNFIISMYLFTYSCITDFIDGYIARKYNMKSIIGSIIDPLADKFLMTVCVLSLTYISSIPWGVATIIIGRDLILSFMSIYYRYKSLPQPKTFNKFVSIGQIPTISVHPNFLGKFNTFLQMLYIGSLVYKPLLDNYITNTSLYFDGFGYLVGITTFLSGLNYIFNKNSWKYIK